MFSDGRFTKKVNTNGATGHREWARGRCELQAVFAVDEDGKCVAWCPALQGCCTQGDSYEEASANMEDVIERRLAELRDEAAAV